MLGALGTGLAVLFARTLPIARADAGSLVVPAALSTVLTGFLRLGSDSIPLGGRTWTVGDSSYHSHIQAQRTCEPFIISVKLYEG